MQYSNWAVGILKEVLKTILSHSRLFLKQVTEETSLALPP